jgi:hypothetical protein
MPVAAFYESDFLFAVFLPGLGLIMHVIVDIVKYLKSSTPPAAYDHNWTPYSYNYLKFSASTAYPN